MSDLFKHQARPSMSDTLSWLRNRSGLIAEAVFIRHFLVLKRLIIVLGLVVTVVLVSQVYLATNEVASGSTTRGVTLEVDLLDEAITTIERRQQELPQTVVGNRREYFVAPR